MKNPFNHENYPSNELKRNTFPCSFQNNLTMKYGYIYPAGIWRTVPGATYKIKPTLGLNFMPTTFPVQTRQKVYVHYFYGRDRNFWKDYKDFVNGQRPDLVKPYIDESITKARTGKLLDYLGVPTTIVGNYGNVVSFPITGEALAYNNLGAGLNAVSNDVLNYDKLNNLTSINLAAAGTLDGISYTPASQFLGQYDVTKLSKDISSYSSVFLSFINSYLNYMSEPISETKTSGSNTYIYTSPTPRDENVIYKHFYIVFHSSPLKFGEINSYISNDVITSVSASQIVDNNKIKFDLSSVYNLLKGHSQLYMSVFFARQLFNYYSDPENPGSRPDYFGSNPINVESFSGLSYTTQVSQVVDIDDSNSPYWRTGATTDLRARIKLNAYLPRFYETVYNLYYRNPQNNPYMLDGRAEYNKFIPTKDGGLDSNLYQLRRRNWEDDFLTTAVQSPQQGIAPLVGLTDRGATLTLTNDDGTVTRYNVTTTENGSITGIEANDTSSEPVLTKALIDAVSYGISIEDIRNVNAMQKWLELNLRKGYQYKDIIQARWGISISYNELDLPEFIGGFTKDVQLQAVTQTANVNDDVTGQLGWQAGRLYASGEGREITHYCDEEGFIMCLITVVPVPNYSQLLSKHWFERDLLDSYQPEFNHIGFQPITYKEVCPVQAYQESSENVNVLEQTFGYQRPWYQYFNYTDEVHGQFRTTFKDFLINRVFDVKPELSESFLLVDPEQINDVFNVPDADDDKIIGAIYHNCVAKLPISLYAQARLE